jgi:hypothetical protein
MMLQPKLLFSGGAAGAFGPKEENFWPDPQINSTTLSQAEDFLQKTGQLTNSGINPFDICYRSSGQRTVVGPDTQQLIDQIGAFWETGKAETAEGNPRSALCFVTEERHWAVAVRTMQ